MRATWPTARKSEPEPGASAGARLRNRSGRQSDEPVVAPFFVGAAPLMPNVLPPPGPAHVAAPGAAPGAAGLGRGIFRRGVPFAFRAALGSGPPLRGGDAGWSARPSECAGGGVFLPGSFRCCRPSFPESFLSPVPSAIVLPSALGSGPPPRRRGCGAVRPPVGMCGRRSISPRFLLLLPPFFSRILSLPGSFRHRPPCGAWERPSSTGRGCGVVRPPVGMCGRRSVSLRFLPPPPPSFSRCRSGPRDFSGKRCGGEK